VELGRRQYGDLSQGRVNFVPFIYELHESLALGVLGVYTLGVIALAWTIDAFYALYLTMPRSTASFWRRWKPSWLVKPRAGVFRLNFDLHRAGGLWFWPLVLIFGWLSLMWNLPQVFSPVKGALFDTGAGRPTFLEQPKSSPRLSWREAQAIAERAMAEQAQQLGFTLREPGMFGYLPEVGVFLYGAQSSLDVQRRAWNTGVWIDGDTGALVDAFRPSGRHTGDTITWWLRALHFADVYGWMSYRLLVCAFGLVIVMLSVTDVYIWWKKRKARVAGIRRGLAATV